MAKRKQLREYTADEFRQLKEKLKTHSTKLATLAVLREVTFDEAVRVRDVVQSLVTTQLALSHIDTLIQLSGSGKGRYFASSLSLPDCGLDENGDPIPEDE